MDQAQCISLVRRTMLWIHKLKVLDSRLNDSQLSYILFYALEFCWNWNCHSSIWSLLNLNIYILIASRNISCKISLRDSKKKTKQWNPKNRQTMSAWQSQNRSAVFIVLIILNKRFTLQPKWKYLKSTWEFMTNPFASSQEWLSVVLS